MAGASGIVSEMSSSKKEAKFRIMFPCTRGNVVAAPLFSIRRFESNLYRFLLGALAGSGVDLWVKVSGTNLFSWDYRILPVRATSGTEGPFTVYDARTRVVFEQHLGEG